MKILAIISGEYGERHVSNIVKRAPEEWTIEVWRASNAYPPVIDYPEDYLPEFLPRSELLLSFGEHRGIAELLPEIAQSTGARSVIAPVDNEAWLPRGLARQLKGWLERMQVVCVTPKPLCSLTEKDYAVSRFKRIQYQDNLISQFAYYFGQPNIIINVDADKKTIKSIEIRRDAVCGCANYVAERLIGVSVDEAEEKAGLLHHHFPCLASMGKDSDYADTLMHVSGNILKDNILDQIKPHKNTKYISPGKRTNQD